MPGKGTTHPTLRRSLWFGDMDNCHSIKQLPDPIWTSGLPGALPASFSGMTRPESIQHIREACKTVALQFMKIHPALPGLQDAETQADCLKALHEMTVHLETIKKKIGRLEKRDDSSLL